MGQKRERTGGGGQSFGRDNVENGDDDRPVGRSVGRRIVSESASLVARTALFMDGSE